MGPHNNWLHICGLAVVAVLALFAGACSSDSDYSGQTDQDTYPEDMSDLGAESYCLEIDTPDMEACKQGYYYRMSAMLGD